MAGDYSFIPSAPVHQVTEEEISDLNALIRKFKYELEVLGEPVHLRLPRGCTLSNLKLSEVIGQVILEPYHQYISKVKKNIYHFKRGNLPKKRKSDGGGTVTVGNLYKTGNRPTHLAAASFEEIEEAYWKEVHRITSTPAAKLLATYASDVLGSRMDFDSKRITLCNLNTVLQKIVTKYSKPIPGISTPMLYIGVWLSTFTQHLEDKDLWSASFLHAGEPKFWYMTPASSTLLLESKIHEDLKVFMKKNFPGCTALLRHKCTLMDPKWYQENNIPLIKIVQLPGDLVIIPPYVYHFGFNAGWNFSEAVNFGTKSWLPFGLLAKECDDLEHDTIDLEPFVADLMPENYSKYLNGELTLVHPFDATKQVQVVPAPGAVQVDERVKDYLVKSRGLDHVHLSKVVNGKEYVFGVIGEIKTWMEKKETEGMIWASTGEPVCIPDGFYTQRDNPVVIYPRTMFISSPGFYDRTDVKHFNAYLSFEDQHETLSRNDLCTRELSGWESGMDWRKDAQLVVIFASGDGVDDDITKECTNILWGKQPLGNNSLCFKSDFIFGAKRCQLTNNRLGKIPLATGLVIPKIKAIQTRSFSIPRAEVTSSDDFKVALAKHGNLSELKAIVFLCKDTSLMGYLQDFLSVNLHVAVAGGSVEGIPDGVSASGFLIYGKNVTVGCCVIPDCVDKIALKTSFNKLQSAFTKPVERKTSFSLIFAPKKYAKKLDKAVQRLMEKDFSGSECAGISTTSQVGRDIVDLTEQQNILFYDSAVFMLITWC